MSNSLVLSLSWDSPASVTFPGYSSYPKPHLPERDLFFLPHAHHTLYVSREQFLPLLGIIMKIPHFFQESMCPWGWRLYSSRRFKYWSEHHATETMRKFIMYQHVTPSYIVKCTLMNYLWTYSGNTDCQIGMGPEWLREQIRRGSSSDSFCAFEIWAMCMYYWVEKYITNIKFIHKI